MLHESVVGKVMFTVHLTDIEKLTCPFKPEHTDPP
jgi:hypothetical protein